MNTVAGSTSAPSFPPYMGCKAPHGKKMAQQNSYFNFNAQNEKQDPNLQSQSSKISKKTSNPTQNDIESVINTQDSKGNMFNVAYAANNGEYLLTVLLANEKKITLSTTENVRVTNTDDGGIIITTQAYSRRFDNKGQEISTGKGSDPLVGTDDNEIIFNINGDCVSGGAGNDTIISVKNANINGGEGDDKITILNSAGFGGRDMQIDGGNGDDVITIGDSYGATVIINGGDGDDVIITGNSYSTTLTVNGENGNDSIYMGNSYGSGDITATGGDGNDSITTSNKYGGNSTVDGGNGNDSIVLGFQYSGNTNVNGADGHDNITIGNIGRSSVKISGGDGDDSITINKSILGSIIIEGGKGNDTIQVGDMCASTLNIVGGSEKTEEEPETERSALEQRTYEAAMGIADPQDNIQNSTVDALVQRNNSKNFGSLLSQSVSLGAQLVK